MNPDMQIVTEPFRDCDIDVLNQLVKKYPDIRNIAYGWGDVISTDKPDFPVNNPMKVLTNVWKDINNLPVGYYMVAARDQRTLNIYYRRWLCNPKWKYLESGIIDGHTPFLVLNKCAR
jgi:hypothetical protein